MGGQQPISASGADAAEQPAKQQAANEGSPAPAQVSAESALRSHNSAPCDVTFAHDFLRMSFLRQSFLTACSRARVDWPAVGLHCLLYHWLLHHTMYAYLLPTSPSVCVAQPSIHLSVRSCVYLLTCLSACVSVCPSWL